MEVQRLLADLEGISSVKHFGRVTAVLGLLVEIAGVERRLHVSSRCNLIAQDGRRVLSEVVGFRNGKALVMPFGSLDGIGLGTKAEIVESQPTVSPSDA